MTYRRLASLFLLILAILIPVALVSGQPKEQGNPADPFAGGVPTDQIIIKFRTEAATQALLRADVRDTLPELSQAAGEELTFVRPMSGDAYVLGLNQARPPAEVTEISAALAQMAGVEYAEPDLIKQATGYGANITIVTPNDARFAEQWHYGYTFGSSEGLNLLPAWDITIGITTTVVAVIDTGILNHTDLSGRTMPGYDFISNSIFANDGDGRDNDPSDPGDWIDAGECGFNPAIPSSWHGTHVAGTIGANTNNSTGVAGVNWGTRILPIRVLGKCGGMTSDIVDGIRWAAGLSVSGVPANAYPADVVNLSLGGAGSCSTAEQDAFNDVIAAGTTVIVAAGNSDDNAGGYSPASCNGVITVAANDRSGDRAFYSNYGSVVEITGPGGETSTASDGVLSTLDGGTMGPLNDDAYAFYQGTSMAAPHVAGLASLMLAVDPTLTPGQILSLLQANARSFPVGSSCNTSICGSGIADAYATLQAMVGSPPDYNIYLPVVTQAPPAPPGNPIKNGNFEKGPVDWAESSTNGWDLILESADFPSGVSPHGGSWAAWLGGDDDEISTLTQNVTIPAGASYLTYYHWIYSEDVCGYDAAGVLINGEVPTGGAYWLCSDTSTGGWTQFGVNLSQWAGQQVELVILVGTDSLLTSGLFVDDVALGSQGGSATGAGLPADEQAAAAARLSGLRPQAGEEKPAATRAWREGS